MYFEDEQALERYVRNLIAKHITNKNRIIYVLDNKKAVDIIICRDGNMPALFFLEAKYHQISHGRLGFGSGSG